MNNSEYNKDQARRPAGIVYPELVNKLARSKAFFDLLQRDLSEYEIAKTLGITQQAFNRHVQKAKKEIEYLENGGESALITPQNENLSDKAK